MADTIIRTMKRRVVTIKNPVTDEVVAEYNVSRATTPQKELIKYIKKNEPEHAVVATVELVEERRSMSLDTFIANSEIMTEEETV